MPMRDRANIVCTQCHSRKVILDSANKSFLPVLSIVKPDKMRFTDNPRWSLQALPPLSAAVHVREAPFVLARRGIGHADLIAKPPSRRPQEAGWHETARGRP